jgi:hypothetical protein
VRQHGAQEGEAAKASPVDFDASASGAEFEQMVIPALLCVSTPADSGTGESVCFCPCESVAISVQNEIGSVNSVSSSDPEPVEGEWA